LGYFIAFVKKGMIFRLREKPLFKKHAKKTKPAIAGNAFIIILTTEVGGKL